MWIKNMIILLSIILISLSNVSTDEKLSNRQKKYGAKSHVTGRARSSKVVFEDEQQRSDYYDDYDTQSNNNDDYDDYGQTNNQGVRGGRYYQPENGNKKVTFPIDDARESLSGVIDGANYGVYSQYQSNYNNNEGNYNNRVKGGRGLYPFNSNEIDQTSQYGSQYNKYESENLRRPLNYGETGISSQSSIAQPYNFVDPYSIKNYLPQNQANQQNSQHYQQQSQAYKPHAQNYQQQAYQQNPQHYQIQNQAFQQNLHKYQQSQANPGYNPHTQHYKPSQLKSDLNQYLGPYSPEYLQQQYLSSFPGVSHQDLIKHHPPASVTNAFPGTFNSPDIYFGPNPPTGNYKVPNGPEIIFTPPPGYPGHSSNVRPQYPIKSSPPHTYQHLYERPFSQSHGQFPIGPQQHHFPEHPQGLGGGHPFSQYAGQFGNYAQGPVPFQYGAGGLDPQEFGPNGGVGGLAGHNGFGNPAFAPQQGFGGPFNGQYDPLSARQPDSFGRRIGRAIEEISKNDDLECVPRLVCQMIGSRMRTRPLPNFIDVDSLGTLIEAIPAGTPPARYIRAALLGVTNGDRRCYHAYNRCPSSEDDILYYLNNHKGGFFKFFNDDDSSLDEQSNSQQHHHQSPSELAQGSNSQSQLNLLALQNIAAALGTASPAGASNGVFGGQSSLGNLNLGQLGAAANGIQLLSNLGSLFGGRGRTKDTDILSNATTNDTSSLKGINFTEVISNMIKALSPNSTSKVKREVKFETKDTNSTESENVSNIIQPRIVNRYPLYSNHVDQGQQFLLNSNNRYSNSDQLNINHANKYHSQNNKVPINPDAIPVKTGTGNLAFENEYYNYLYNRPGNNPIQDRENEEDRLDKLQKYYTNTHRLTSNYNKNKYYSRPSSSSSSSSNNYYNRYSHDRYRPHSSSSSNSGRIYVTNAHGVNEYYIENGRKHYL